VGAIRTCPWHRDFDGTMTFDGPAVADEAILPYWTNSRYPTRGSSVPHIISDA
jgi:hypothetical protein